MGKPKAVNYELLLRKNHSEIYELLDDVRGNYHDELHGAQIALAWRKKLKADIDGRLVLGRCVRASDLQKEFAPYDFVILLNKEIWDNPEFTIEKKTALIDHELCHAAPAEDSAGDPRYDDRGRQVWRVRKHDVEEFRVIVERHGCYKADLEAFAQSLLNSKQLELHATR